MHRLKVLSGDAVIKILESFSFAVIGQKGSHIKLRRTKSKIHQTLPVFGRHDPELICECDHPRKYHGHMGLSENLIVGTNCNACRCREFKEKSIQGPKNITNVR